MPGPVKVLFVCVGNSCRSQIAEALARHQAGDVIEPASAGLSPMGSIAEPTLQVLREKGVRADGQYSKGLSDLDQFVASLVVNMTGIPGRSVFPRGEVVDWDVEDPFGEDLATYRRICDDIEARLGELAARLREKKEARGS